MIAQCKKIKFHMPKNIANVESSFNCDKFSVDKTII